MTVCKSGLLSYENDMDESGFKEIFQPVLKEIIKKSKKILDFGSLTGYFVYKLSKLYHKKQFYGADINRKAILGGRKRYGKRIHLSYGKLKGIYDLIFTIHVLHELKGITIANQIKEFYKHLKRGGFVYVYDYRKVSKPVFRRHFERRGDKENFEQEYKEHNKMSKRDYEILFKKAGFKTIILKDNIGVKFYYVGQKVE